MDFLRYRTSFDAVMGVRPRPNARERELFSRAQQYVRKIANIPGIEMVAVVNSLSMYATRKDSDIDLFIVTAPHMLWLVRVFVTLRFRQLGVWRHGDDIAGNFCLSFFVTTDAMDLEKIAIKNDIYLAYWIYFMKPIIDRHNTYDFFLQKNNWVTVDRAQKTKNLRYLVRTKSAKISLWHRVLSAILRLALEWKTRKKYRALGSPEGVIIDKNMLKFHDRDRRWEIRDTIERKNFDK